MSSASAPLIYLDSSDYIDFAAKNCPAEKQAVHDFLVERVTSGEIKIAFSFFHVGEVIREFSPQHFDDRLNKARILMSLTKGLTFKYPLQDFDPLSQDGYWFPELKLPAELTARGLKLQLIEMLQNDPRMGRKSRRERRQMLSRSNLATLIRNLPDDPDLSALGNLALPPEFKGRNVLRDLLLGRVDETFVENAFLKMFADLVLLVGALDGQEKQPSIVSMVNTLFDNIDVQIRRVMEVYDESKTQLGKIRDLEKQIRSTRSQEFGTLISKEYEEMRLRLVTLKRDIAHFIQNYEPIGPKFKKDDRLPPILGEVLPAYVKANIRDKRTRGPSDIVDIFHSSYLPFCDLWRGDRRFANILIGSKISGYEKIVPSLSDLPGRIDKMLS